MPYEKAGKAGKWAGKGVFPGAHCQTGERGNGEKPFRVSPLSPPRLWGGRNMVKNRHPRHRKPDRLTDPDMRANEAKCYSAIAPLDRLADAMERKWGVDRLVTLVSPDTAAKYGSALGRLNDAIRDQDAEQCIHMAKVCMRGLQAMDQEAEAAGAEKPAVLAEAEIDGFHFCIVGDAGDWKPIAEDRPNMRIYSLREVASAIKSTHGIPIVDAIKTQFPGSQINEPIKPLPNSFYKNGGDNLEELPW